MPRPHLSAELRRQVEEDAGHRCGYCLSEEDFMGATLTIDHIIPLADGGSNMRENLWSACRQCNEAKQARTHARDPETSELVPLFNPRTDKWAEHFTWSPEYTHIIGSSVTGRATVVTLQLNRPILVSARRRWFYIGWRPVF